MTDPDPSAGAPYPFPSGGPGARHLPPPGPPRRSPRGFFVAGGVLGIIASVNLFLMGAVIQAMVRSSSLLAVVGAWALTGILLASLSCSGRAWAALASALLQLAALLGVLALPFGGYRVLSSLATGIPVPLHGGFDGGLGAVLLLGMLGLIQVPLSLLSAIFSLVAHGRREG